jgi:hypothetical protein
MTMHKSAVPVASRRNRGDQLKDEVYRHMFRLEAQRPGADRDLAVALLRACVASDSVPKSGKERQWLKKICPICLAMIEAALQAKETSRQCIQ